MSRLSERLDKLQRRLDEADRVILILPPRRYTPEGEGPWEGEPVAMGGTPASRRRAIDAWLAANRPRKGRQRAKEAIPALGKPARRDGG